MISERRFGRTVIIMQQLLKFLFGIKYLTSDSRITDHLLITQGLKCSVGDMKIFHYFLATQVTIVCQCRTMFLPNVMHIAQGLFYLSFEFLELFGIESYKFSMGLFLYRFYIRMEQVIYIRFLVVDFSTQHRIRNLAIITPSL